MQALLLLLLSAPCKALAVEIKSPDGDIHWNTGEAAYSFLNKRGKRRSRKLPAFPKNGEWKRRLLFSKKDNFFCVLDERVEELGLHLGAPRGSAAAKMAVSESTLRLVRKSGSVVWKKKLRDRHFGGEGTKNEIPLQIAENGTLAVLLQDDGPLSKTRPVILVFDPRGREKLALNYTAWSRVDKLSLSSNGKRLAVRGLGRIPEKDTWGKAVGVYNLNDEGAWIRGVPKAESISALQINSDGWVCCVREGPVFFAFDPSGHREHIEAAEIRKRFGGRQ